MSITTFFVSWEQESSTGATSITTDKLPTTTAAGEKAVGYIFESVWIWMVLGVIVLVALIVLSAALFKTCKKQQGNDKMMPL